MIWLLPQAMILGWFQSLQFLGRAVDDFASLATARRADHDAFLVRQTFDMVIVDEAHHLKNRTSQNWKLVHQLKKRFLLLLSATPVQNNLVELYNLLTLLKPGVFKTQREFSSTYMTPGKPRTPANRQQFRDLMRDCMIRNTRALADVYLPRRQAYTMKLSLSKEETFAYSELNRLIQSEFGQSTSQQKMSFRHLLAAAGSSPAAARTALDHYLSRHNAGPAWFELADRYQTIPNSCKDLALMELPHQNPQEKK